MIQENQMTQPKLEEVLLDIGSLSSFSRKIDQGSLKPSERNTIYETAATILDKENFEDMMLNLTKDPSFAYRVISSGAKNRVEEIKEEYQNQKSRITKEVADQIDESLSGIKNKGEAAAMLSAYFRDLSDISELDQRTANKYARRDLAKRAKVDYLLEGEGSIKQYKDEHEMLQLRTATSEYLRGDNEKGYTIDRKKLGKIMDNVESGAVLYTKADIINEVMKKAKEKKRNN